MTTTSEPLRVLFVTPRYFPYTGGIETHVHEVSRRLAKESLLHITVLTTDPSGRLPDVEIADGVTVRRVRTWPKRGDFYFAPSIYRVISQGAWDLVHCQGIHTLVAPIAMLAARRAGIPYVVTFHTGGHSSRLRHSMRHIQWNSLKPLLARADHLIGVSEFEAQLFHKQLGLDPARISVIPNGSGLTAGSCDHTPIEAGLIVSVGRLERYKGHHRVVAALSDVRARIPQAHLLILGTGPFEAELRRMAVKSGVEDSVEIRAVPPGSRQEMATTLKRASLVTLLSDYEAHPLAVMEALALDKPVLATDTSGLRELAQRGLVQALPLRATPREVTSAIVDQLTHPRRPSLVHVPSWDECVTQLEALYRRSARRTRCAS